MKKEYICKDGEHTTAHLCKSKEKTKVATTSVDVQKMKTKVDSVDVEPKKTTDASSLQIEGGGLFPPFNLLEN
ncbi:hypothetical protein P8452_59139 [Trifolium repens]|nr:hypothetical protein P8452_59139 [Trifolium repens]